MKILITGANGQLGYELKRLSHLLPLADFVYSDIEDLNLTDAANVDRYFTLKGGFDYIINCAAYTNVDKAESECEEAQKINAESVHHLCNQALKYDANLIHISTDYVFNGKGHIPYKESDAVNPESAYGKTKLAGEEIFMESGAKGIIIRTSWLYSSHGHNFVKTMLRLGKEKESLGVVFDQVGTPTYAKDLAKAILDIIKINTESKAGLHADIFHFSNEGVCSWYDFALEIMEKANLDCKINPIESHEYPVPAPRPSYSVLNKHKIKDRFEIQIPHWKTSLNCCLDILLNEK